MTREQLAKVITDFMLSPDGGGVKLVVWADGTIHDDDSNWGFHPLELADKILEMRNERSTPQLREDL